jgi:hypothetical protein
LLLCDGLLAPHARWHRQVVAYGRPVSPAPDVDFITRSRRPGMKVIVAMLLLAALAGCSSTATNPESAEAKCKGTWDSRTQTCIGG